jgi:hypothetical protein
MHVHTKGIDSLHDKISKHILPYEYGGTAGPLSDLWGKLVILCVNLQIRSSEPAIFYMSPGTP